MDAFLTITGLAAGNTITLQVLVAGAVIQEHKLAAVGITDETFSFGAKVYAAAASGITIKASQNNGADKAIKIGDSYNGMSVAGIR